MGGTEIKQTHNYSGAGFSIGQQVTMAVGPKLSFDVRNGHCEEMQLSLDPREE